MKLILDSSNTAYLEIEGGKLFYLYDSSDGILEIRLVSEVQFSPKGKEMSVSSRYLMDDKPLGKFRNVRLS